MAVVPIKLSNPFLDVTYPADGTILAILDTGYEGFVMVPQATFNILRLNELRSRPVTLIVADGRKLLFKEVLGLLEFPAVDIRAEGAIQTYSGAKETLIGMSALRQLIAHVNGCSRNLSLEEC